MKRYIKAKVLSVLDESYKVQAALACDINTRPEVLAELAKIDDANLTVWIAKNPNTSAETLHKIVEGPDTWEVICRWVAQHDNVSPETLDLLSTNGDCRVRQRVAENFNTSVDTLKKLTNDEDRAVCREALATLHRRGITNI